MKRKVSTVLTILLLVTGVGILLYPLASDWYNGRAQTMVVENYDKAVGNLREEELTALWEAARSYNEGLLGNIILTDPFDEHADSKASEEYNALLNIKGDGVMGYVRIPKIDVRLPVYHGTASDTLANGAGHLENTSLPVGGTGTHAVLSAHTGLPTAALFTNLIKLQEGELFFLEVLDETLAYRVDRIAVVEPSDTSNLRIDRTEDYVTLVTCTPYGINSHRLLVRGVRMDYEEAAEEEAGQPEAKAVTWNWPYIIAGFIFFLLLVSYVVYRHIKKKRSLGGEIHP